MIHELTRRKRTVKAAIVLAVCLLFALLIEFLLANASMLFAYNEEDYPTIDPSEYTKEEIREDGSILVLESGRLDFTDVPGGLFSVSFDIS